MKTLFNWCLLFFITFTACSNERGIQEKELPDTPPGTPETMAPVVFAAFPGAEGFGRETTGGRGGKVYMVTSLEDGNMPGTLRYGIENMGAEARTIVFQVSGTIYLKRDLKIVNGNLTIAGQTAPGDGICLAGFPVFTEADNVIVRYLRIRMGDKQSIHADGADAFGGRFHKNIIIDHCSISWCTDECASFYNNENFTLQWCIISESLRLSGHSKGAHGYGAIWGGMKASFHHNLLVHHDSRNPRLGPGVKSTKTNELTDMRNNVIYNWGANSCYGGEAMHVNIVNNYYKPGPASASGWSRIVGIDKKISESDQKSYPAIFDTWGTFFIDGNVVEGNAAVTKDNWLGATFDQKYQIDDLTKASVKLAAPLDCSVVTTHSAAEAYEKVLADAGCSLMRDAIDERIIRETREGTATFKGLSVLNGNNENKKYPKPGIIDSQDDLRPANAPANWSAWPILKQGAVPVDTDKDGIPDEGEKRFGLNPADASDVNGTTVDPAGKYTNIEMYLHSLVISDKSKNETGK